MLEYELIRYTIIGGFCALLDLGILYLLTDIVGIYYILSAILAFFVSVSVAYILQKYITFRNKEKKHLKQVSLFVLYQALGLGIYVGGLRLLVNFGGVYYMLAAIFMKIIVFARNYLMNKYFNF